MSGIYGAYAARGRAGYPFEADPASRRTGHPPRWTLPTWLLRSGEIRNMRGMIKRSRAESSAYDLVGGRSEPQGPYRS